MSNARQQVVPGTVWIAASPNPSSIQSGKDQENDAPARWLAIGLVVGAFGETCPFVDVPGVPKVIHDVLQDPDPKARRTTPAQETAFSP
jgi:hypothetical protein